MIFCTKQACRPSAPPAAAAAAYPIMRCAATSIAGEESSFLRRRGACGLAEAVTLRQMKPEAGEVGVGGERRQGAELGVASGGRVRRGARRAEAGCCTGRCVRRQGAGRGERRQCAARKCAGRDERTPTQRRQGAAEASGAGWRRGPVGTWALGASEAGGLGAPGREVHREVRWRGAAESARQRVLGEREACCWNRTNLQSLVRSIRQLRDHLVGIPAQRGEVF